MKFKPRRSSQIDKVTLNVPSLIDVVFLLLTFFLFSSVISAGEAQLVPAIHSKSTGNAAPAIDFTPQVVFVEVRDGHSVYRVGSRVLTSRADLLEVLRELPHELGVFVRVEDATSVAFAVGAIQCCYDAGFEKVTYVPQSRE